MKFSCGSYGITVIIIGSGLGYIQILDKTVCISHSASTPGKGMNPTILHPVMGT